MKKQLISIAITTALLAGTVQHAYADDQQATDSRHKQYIGTGIGATAGALVAGPVGFLVGGLIGNLAAKHDVKTATEAQQALAAEQLQSHASAQPVSSPAVEDEATETIVVAQAGEIETVINDDIVDHTSELKDILVENMSLDVFFLSGSTTVETFYQSRLLGDSKLCSSCPISIFILKATRTVAVIRTQIWFYRTSASIPFATNCYRPVSMQAEFT